MRFSYLIPILFVVGCASFWQKAGDAATMLATTSDTWGNLLPPPFNLVAQGGAALWLVLKGAKGSQFLVESVKASGPDQIFGKPTKA